MSERRSSKGAVAEPIGPQPPSFDWSARSRMTMTDAQRYTRFVTIAKRALLLAALALIAAVIAYSLQPREQGRVAMTFERVGTVDNDLAMVKPKLTGSDDSGNPFVVTADSAVQDGRNSRRVRLHNVEADVSLKDSGWISATAQSGLVDATAKKISLWGNISVFSDSGYALQTDRIDADLATGMLHGEHRVTGQGPSGTLSADRFRIDKQKKQIFLMGHVQMTIYASEIKKKNTGGAKRK